MDMEIRDELTNEVLADPDLTSGYLYTKYQYYHKYTEEELSERRKPTLQEQLDANATAIAELALMLTGGDA